MNKRITSILLCIVMIVSMLVTAVPAFAVEGKSTTFKLTADKTAAEPGDTITFTVSMGAVDGLKGLGLDLRIPSGLTFVSGSGKVTDGLMATMAAANIMFTESSKIFMVASCNYTSAADTVLMTFQCKVDDGTSGNKTVELGLVDDDPDNCCDLDYDNIAVTFTPATVTVTAAPKPATGISLNKSTTTIYTGANETLIATVEPNDTTDTVTWTSSNTTVATVDTNGKVTAVATGTATITATAGSQSASCVVTVENAPCTHTNKTNVGEKSSTCKEQGWEAYSKCNDCGQLFDKNGNEISAIPYLSLADHTPAQTAAAEYLKSAATCTSPAVYYEHCSVCDEKLSTTFTSGSTVPHTESGWKSDADGHWKECTVCNAITTAKVAHTPDHEGHATEEYAIKCTECSWEIEAQLGHTHVFDKEVATDVYKASDATCTAKATYYKSCACGEKGTETFEYGELAEHNWTPATCTAPKTCSVCSATEGEPNGHTEGTDWKSDANYHWHICSVDGCGAVIESSKAAHTPDREAATETDPIKCTECGYIIEEQLAPRTPVTSIAATITAPALGATPDYHPVFTSTPADSVELDEITWYKIAIANFTGTNEDDWDEMASDEAFTTGYYYAVDMYFNPNDGFKLTESTTGTVNGKPHDSTYGELYDGHSYAYLSGVFEPLAPEYTIDLPVSLIVKLTGDEKPGKETFKFEIYDLGYKDAEFKIVNDTVVAENLEFNEDGLAFVGGTLKIKAVGEEQLSNLTEGFSVRMVKGSTKGWTYASEQWYIELFFENDALDVRIGVKEIVDGEISEVYANGMSFAVRYEAVSEPDPIDPGPINPGPIDPGPIDPDPTEPDPTEPGTTEPDPTDPGEPANPQPPETGDNSMMGLWTALLFVSGAGVVGITIYGRKKKYSAK